MNTSPNKTALLATLHCLTGCAIGEVLGMVVSTALGWSTVPSIILSIVLAFLFGYSFSATPLLRARLPFKKALTLVLAADTISIATMELVDNGFIMVVPGAIQAGLDTALFWVSMALSLVVAFLAAFPVNKYLIAKGMGHAVVHEYHHQHHDNVHQDHTHHQDVSS
jgi:hypothetical protein